MGKKNIGGAVLDDLKALPKKILKPYYKNGKLNANKVAIDGIPFGCQIISSQELCLRQRYRQNLSGIRQEQISTI